MSAAGLVLASIVLLSPLTLASVTPGPRTACQVAAFVALALVVSTRAGLKTAKAVAAPPLALAAVAAWGILQAMPWPGPIAELLSPRVAGLWNDANGALGQAGVHLSIAPAVSVRTALQWAAVASALWAAAAVGRSRPWRRLVFGIVLAMALFEIAYAFHQIASDPRSISGAEVPGVGGQLRGTFIHPNHLAFFLAMAGSMGTAWLWWSWRRWRLGLLGWEHLLLPAAFQIAIAVGLVGSGSRGGLLAWIVATAGQWVLLIRRRAHRRRDHKRQRAPASSLLALVLTIVTIVAAVVMAAGLQGTLARWLVSPEEIATHGRLPVYTAALERWLQSPWTGTGLGTFREALPRLLPTTVGDRWEHVHNGPLELLVTAGLIGLPWAAMAAFLAGRRLLSAWRRGRRSEDRAAALGALGALLAAGVQEMVEFGLTLPANALTFAVLCGLACGVPRRGERPAGPPEPFSAQILHLDPSRWRGA